MENTKQNFLLLLKKHWLGLLGLTIVFLYLTSAFQLIDYPDKVFIVLFLAISPVAIVGVYAVANQLSKFKKSIGIDLAKIYGIIAFGLFETMMCIQFGSRIYFKEHLFNNSNNEVPNEVIKMIYNGVNSVQFTIDIAFDIFYCLMIILFSFAMLNNKLFGKAIGAFGAISGISLLVLNLWTFPYPPAEVGLIDLGPLTAAWWIWVIVLLVKIERSEKNIAR